MIIANIIQISTLTIADARFDTEIDIKKTHYFHVLRD